MEFISGLLDKILGFNFTDWVTAVNAVLVASIGVFMLVPGDQPEKAIQKIVDILAKFSRK